MHRDLLCLIHEITIRVDSVRRQIDGMAPTFSKKPAIRQEEDGKRLLFECRIQADPRPSVTWSHNGAAVQDSGRHRVSHCVMAAGFLESRLFEETKLYTIFCSMVSF